MGNVIMLISCQGVCVLPGYGKLHNRLHICTVFFYKVGATFRGEFAFILILPTRKVIIMWRK